MTHGQDDRDVRALLARAVPDVTPPADVDADLARGRAALGRRRSVLATLAVAAGTVLVVAGAVTLPGRLAPAPAADPAAPTTTGSPAPRPAPADADGRDATAAVLEPVPLEPASQGQRAEHVVATLLPRGWSVVDADPTSLLAADGRADDGATLVVRPAEQEGTPPVLGGVGDFERLGGAFASYYLVDRSSGEARPSMVFELTYGRWAQVSASPELGWGMAELTAFASGLRAPFTCAEPCEVPLVP